MTALKFTKILIDHGLLWVENGYNSITVYITNTTGRVYGITTQYREILRMSKQDAEAFAHSCLLSEVFE